MQLVKHYSLRNEPSKPRLAFINTHKHKTADTQIIIKGNKATGIATGRADEMSKDTMEEKDQHLILNKEWSPTTSFTLYSGYRVTTTVIINTKIDPNTILSQGLGPTPLKPDRITTLWVPPEIEEVHKQVTSLHFYPYKEAANCNSINTRKKNNFYRKF